jgi:hypothetical protein
MVRIRKTSVSQVIPVSTPSRIAKSERRREFLARTTGKVWDSETEQFVENDSYNAEEE